MSPLYGMPKVAGRQLSERVDDPVTLDPDIALWPVVPLSIWPFAGAPTEGRWPKNWLGIDENSALWVCTEGGTPGTWAQVGSGGRRGVAGVEWDRAGEPDGRDGRR